MPKKAIAGGAVALGLVATGGGAVVADNHVNPYTDKGTHYELPLKGDTTQQNDRLDISLESVEATLRIWNDEESIAIRPEVEGGPAKVSRQLFSSRVNYKTGTETVFIEPRGENEFDIDFVLQARTKKNVWRYNITGADSQNWYYQDVLSPELLASEGDGRPENVVGSYAVYHKTKKNHCTNCGTPNYATGKIMHVYRPKAIDADGKEVWCALDYANGILSVTCPRRWLNKAAYPVTVDPTFGYTSVPGSASSNEGARGHKQGSGGFYTASTGDTVNSCSVYSSVSNDDVELAVYDTSGTVPDSRVGSAYSVTPDGAGWYTTAGDMDTSLSDGTTYTVSHDPTTAWGSGVRYYDSTAGTKSTSANSSDSLTDTWSEDYDLESVYGAYCTYTAGSGDTCTYSSGDWEVLYSDDCEISSDVNIDAGSELRIIRDGAGSFQVTNGATIYDNDGAALLTSPTAIEIAATSNGAVFNR